MSPSPKNLKTTPRMDEGLVVPREPVTAVERSTRGLSGRIWTLAVDVEVSGPWDPRNRAQVTTWRGMSEHAVAKHACEFLRQHEPDLYAKWHSDVEHVARRARALKASLLETGEDAMLKTRPEDSSVAFLSMPAPPGRPQEDVSIELPKIKPGHWLYERHRNAGNGVTRRATAEDCDMEARQDVDSILHYLKAYESLAGERIGRRLFEASAGAQFRDPYSSCMELCLFELKLPAHFMALVHYGMGVHFSVGDAFKHWDGRRVDNRDAEAFLSTKRIFRQLMKLWNEDFPRSL